MQPRSAARASGEPWGEKRMLLALVRLWLLNVRSELMSIPSGLIWTPWPGVWSCWSISVKESLTSCAYSGPGSLPTVGIRRFMFGDVVELILDLITLAYVFRSR